MAISIGDAVTLYRRDHPGIGMAVEKIEDITLEYGNIDKDLQTLIFSWNIGKDFRTKNYAISDFIEKSGLSEDLAMSFLTSNGFYRYARSTPPKNINKINKRFVKVFWFIKPSNYNIKIIKHNIDWYPTEWLKSAKKTKKNT
jgi:hypothetical protein